MPNLVSLTQPSLQILDKTQTVYFGFPNFFPKSADISKIKGIMVLKGKLSETSELRVRTYQISSF